MGSIASQCTELKPVLVPSVEKAPSLLWIALLEHEFQGTFPEKSEVWIDSFQFIIKIALKTHGIIFISFLGVQTRVS